jgi:metal-dependent amidase/aminoacylase/carboxypeptidase family protein
MLKEKPGAYILIGAGSPSGDAPCLHNPYYDFPDSVLPIGADYWTRLVEIRLPAGA